jgi:hypothetical protein
MAYRYGNQNYSKQFLVLTMAYFVLFIWSIIQATDNNAKFQSRPGADGHLQWSRPGKVGFVGSNPAGFVYVFGLAFGLFFMLPSLFGFMLVGLGGLLVILSAKNHQGGSFASMWCLYATLYAFLALIMAFSTKVPKK